MAKHKKFLGLILFTFFIFLISSCVKASEISLIPVEINVDNQKKQVEVEIGSTIQTVLNFNNISLLPLDKVDPPVFSVITEPITINITRVEEKFETEEIIVPFEQQTVRNESLPERQQILVQPGVNGVREITYRLLYENSQLYSRTEVRRVDIETPKPEIIMIGIQAPFSSIPITGKIIYLTSGNIWMMENQSSNRKPILTNGKVDGRVLSLSADEKWLLFTQISNDKDKINELWLKNLEDPESSPVYLKTDNVIHFADWNPGAIFSVLVSTVEPREVAPGWQANNNLIKLTLGKDGKVLKKDEVLESNSGGIYGWWGTSFKFSPDQKNLAFVRPDSLGVVDLKNMEFETLSTIIPYQTQSDWAWVSPISWSTDGRYLFWVDHNIDLSSPNPETSPIFTLKAIDLKTKSILSLKEDVGMFSFSLAVEVDNASHRNRLVFLQSVFPDTSDTSRYRLLISDRDGSNTELLFPNDGMQGLEPQRIFQSPCGDNSSCQIGFIYQGNLWILGISDQFTNHQITGDGLITRIEWN